MRPQSFGGDRTTPTTWRLVLGAAVALTGLAGVWLALEVGLFSVPAGTTAAARDLLVQYGFAALFAVFVIEGLMLLYFAPSESLVPAGMLLLGDSLADYALVVLVAVAGATLGQTLLFALARRGGRDYLVNRSWFRVSDKRLARFEGWFDRWGRLAIPLANTLPFTRGMLTVPAGFSGLRASEFAVLSAVGTLSFELILAGLTVGVLGVL